MTLPVVWLAEAATELQDAVRWYTDINPQLGLHFAHTVENTIGTTAETPLLFAIVARVAGEPEYAAFLTAYIYLLKKRGLSSLPAVGRSIG